MKRNDAIEISNHAGAMLASIETWLAIRHGLNYPIDDGEFSHIPPRDLVLLQTLREHRKQVADKLLALIED